MFIRIYKFPLVRNCFIRFSRVAHFMGCPIFFFISIFLDEKRRKHVPYDPRTYRTNTVSRSCCVQITATPPPCALTRTSATHMRGAHVVLTATLCVSRRRPLRLYYGCRGGNENNKTKAEKSNTIRYGTVCTTETVVAAEKKE